MSWEVNRKNGTISYEKGDYAQSIIDLKLAQSKLESTEGDKHLLADVLVELGKAQEKAADFEDAKKSLNKAISIYNKVKKTKSLEAARALESLGRVHAEQSNFSEAIKLINSAYELKKKLFSEPNADIAESLYNLGLLANRQGDNKLAAEFWQQSLDMRKSTLGEQHQDYGQSLGDLALIYSLTGRINEAEPMLEQALKIKEKAFGLKHPSLAYTALALGGLYQRKLAFAMAEPHFQRAINIFEKKLGNKHPHTGVALNNFGGFYLAQGKLKEATKYFELSLTSKEQSLGKDNPALVKSLRNLAATYTKLDQMQLTDALEERAKNILVKQLNDPANRDGHVFLALADVYSREGNFDEAIKVLEKGLDHAKRVYGPESLELAKMLESLAATMSYKRLKVGAEQIPKMIEQLKEFSKTGKKVADGLPDAKQNELSEEDRKINEQIKQYLSSALRIKRKLFGNEHAEVANTLTRLAECFAMTRDFRTSQLLRNQAKSIEFKTGFKGGIEHMMRKMLEEQRQKGELDSRIFLSSLKSLAFYLEKQDKGQEAEPLYTEYLERLEKCLKKEPSELARELGEMSISYKNKGKTGKAVELAKRAVAILDKAPKASEREKTRTLQILALSCEADNNFADAEKALKRILELQEQQFGSDNWQLKGTLVHLANLSKKLEHSEDMHAYELRAKSLPEPTLEEKDAQNKFLQEELTQYLKNNMIEYLGKMAEGLGGKVS